MFLLLFADKCTTNNSSLSGTINLEKARWNFKSFSDDDILKTIKALDIHKAHSCDDIYIRMMRIYNDVVINPLSIIYKNRIENGMNPDTWKKI